MCQTRPAALLASQGSVGILAGTDIDQIRVRANNVHLDLRIWANGAVRVANGGVNLGISFDSDHPTIKCEAHYTVKSFFLIPLPKAGRTTSARTSTCARWTWR